MQPLSEIDIKKLRDSFGLLLEQEGRSVISQPMHPDCKLSVCIPAYDESAETLIRPLLSLARQKNVDPGLYEVVIVVNNSKKEAQQKTQAYQTNQAALNFLNALTDQKPINNFAKEAEIIQKSKLKVRYINKSSFALADEENHVAHARNRGCMEITHRFFSVPAGADGIIALTDADCRLSENFVRHVIDTFSEHEFLNGLSGAICHEIDPLLPFSEDIKKAFDEHVGYSGRFSPAARFPDKIYFKKRHQIPAHPLNTGQDIVVRVRAWVLSGGLPNRSSGDDDNFGKILEQIEGDVGSTDGYTVFPLIRHSNRVGLSSYGRRVGKMIQEIREFRSGKSDKVYIPDIKAQNLLFKALSAYGREGKLTPKLVDILMGKYGCTVSNLPPLAGKEVAYILNEEMVKPHELCNFERIEGVLMNYFYERLPRRDITEKFT